MEIFREYRYTVPRRIEEEGRLNSVRKKCTVYSQKEQRVNMGFGGVVARQDFADGLMTG